jgi:hypothetical protein
VLIAVRWSKGVQKATALTLNGRGVSETAKAVWFRRAFRVKAVNRLTGYLLRNLWADQALAATYGIGCAISTRLSTDSVDILL